MEAQTTLQSDLPVYSATKETPGLAKANGSLEEQNRPEVRLARRLEGELGLVGAVQQAAANGGQSARRQQQMTNNGASPVI
jgi:hypothetical protein